MFKNYLKVTLRNNVRQKGYSLINLAGLAIGMACCIMIMLWVQYEFSFDRFNENIDNLYFVPTHQQYGDQKEIGSGSPPALGPALKEDFPEIVNSARLTVATVWLKYGDKHFQEGIMPVDPSFLVMMSLPAVAGDTRTALSEPYSIVLTREMAEKYFGTEDPMGKTLIVDNKYNLTVTAVLENVPSNSSIRFNILVPMSFDGVLFFENYIQTWFNCSFYTLAQLHEDADYHDVSDKIAGRIKQALPESNLEPFLYPLKNLHLYSISGKGGHIENVRFFILIALVILLIACFNFMNLATARFSKRAKEVGLRKVIGAKKSEIIIQFLSESILFSLTALVLALVLVEIMLPVFNGLAGTSLTMNYYSDPTLVLSLLGIALVTGIVAGSYPALFLSSFMPVRVLKGTLVEGKKGSWFRKILVVSQFVLSIILIIGTLVVYQQYGYMKDKNLGFDREHLVYMPMMGSFGDNFESVKSELLQNPNILNVTRATHKPTGVYWNGSGWNWEGKDAGTNPLVTFMGVGLDYLETFKIKLLQGEFYTRQLSGSAQYSVVINKTFADLMGSGSPVGKQLYHEENSYTVIGVVDDFNFKPLYQQVEPLAMEFRPQFFQWFTFARISPEDMSGTIGYMENMWKKFNPDYPFDYHFLDDDYDVLYHSEKQLGNILRDFAILAVFVSCLGLFGLASYMAEQRTKEIGIRKVLGATVAAIVQLLSREFVIMVVVANVIAWPLAYYVINRWLEEFAYRMDISWMDFMVAGAGALVITLLTVSYQALKAALTNPVKSLRHE